MDSEVFESFVTLGKKLKRGTFRIPYKKALSNNPWFDKESVDLALSGVVHYLEENKLSKWMSHYPEMKAGKTIGLITAGNIPLVGFHDILCILIMGFKLRLSPSSKDKVLIDWIIQKLVHLCPGLSKKIMMEKSPVKCDAFIATGSDNTSRYFEYNFRSKPNLIRKNRTSLAIIDGKESTDDLHGLFHDIFSYYGFGCRNVSFLMFPEGYPINSLKKFAMKHKWRLSNKAFEGNYKYNKALAKLNHEKFIDYGNLLLKQRNNLFSPVSVVHFSYYKSLKELHSFVSSNINSLQCVVNGGTFGYPDTRFGESQLPEVNEYQDGVDTVKFLVSLS